MSGFTTRQLGKTGLRVSPLGIGGGGGIQSDDLLYAFERGINYFFYSSDLHHWRYRNMAQALRELCAHGSSVRDQVVLATVSYIADPDKLMAILLDQFIELGIDYIDVFHWGWITQRHDLSALIQGARALQEDDETTRYFRQAQTQQWRDMQGRASECNEALLKRGLVRSIGMSFHSRQAAINALPEIDVMMTRYNIAETDVERIVFSHLSARKELNPGVVAFNTAHTGTKSFCVPPANYPEGLYRPTISDCYRFALSNPWVDLVLTGPANRREIDQAFEAIEQGPLDSEDYEFLREYGELFRAPGSPRQQFSGTPRWQLPFAKNVSYGPDQADYPRGEYHG